MHTKICTRMRRPKIPKQPRPKTAPALARSTSGRLPGPSTAERPSFPGRRPTRARCFRRPPRPRGSSSASIQRCGAKAAEGSLARPGRVVPGPEGPSWNRLRGSAGTGRLWQPGGAGGRSRRAGRAQGRARGRATALGRRVVQGKEPFPFPGPRLGDVTLAVPEKERFPRLGRGGALGAAAQESNASNG